MKITNRLYISALISIALIVVFASVRLITSSQIAEKNRKYQLADNMHLAISELQVITSRYLMDREKQTEQQWNLKYHTTAKDVGEELAVSIRADYAVLGDLFSQVTTNYRKTERLIREGASQEKIDLALALEEGLISQLLVASQSMAIDVHTITEETRDEAIEIEQVSDNIMLILMVILVAAVVATSLLVVRSISKPLARLLEGIGIIGGGNLEQKFDIESKDEMGQLATAFDEMTGRLRQSYTSVSDLEKEVTQRSKAEETLRQLSHKLDERLKEQGCLYDVSRLIRKRGLSLEEVFQAVAGLIPPAFQYSKITSARIVVEEQVFQTNNFRKVPWNLTSDITVDNKKIGMVEVCYLEGRPRVNEGPFLKEERELIDSLAGQLAEYIERRKAEESLQRAYDELEIRVAERTSELQSANKELEGFSYYVSHDLRVPLRAIICFSEIFLEDHGENLDKEGRRVLNVVRDNARRTGELIDDLLTFSHQGRKEIIKKSINMEKMAKDIFEELKVLDPEPKPKIKVNTLPFAYGDESLMHEVLINLLSNAIKFSKNEKRSIIEVGGRLEEDENIYYIKDNGVGFDMKYSDKLFGVFQRLHSQEEFKGTGIGLALVQRIIHRHGGRVWAEGKPDKGATFYFTLPLRKRKETKKENEK